MGELREQMVEEMESRNFSPKTIKAYLGHMVAFTKLLGKSPSEMGEDEVRRYLQYLRKERQVSWSNINIAYSALKFFYVETLHREFPIKKIPRPKGEKKLPVVLSPSEVKAIFDMIANLKHRVILMTTYSGGFGVSEVAHLKVTDIDSKRMQIRVEQGKGKKDRYTLLSPALLEHLRTYWRYYHPITWLFPGSHDDKPIGVTTIQKVFQRAKKKPI
jgi:integrase